MISQTSRKVFLLLAITLIAFFLWGCALIAESESESLEEAPILTSKEEVAAYLREHGELPPNFLTKKQAQELGWIASEGNLHEVAPGMSIGGDRFYNREKRLPEKEGRLYYECDICYAGGVRGAERLVFSNDGLIYYTGDHYETFEAID